MLTTQTRRNFLHRAVHAPLSVLWQSWMPRLAFAPRHTAPRGDTLVVIFLRGAADALNVVVPHSEPNYYRQRPTLSIPRPDDSKVASVLRSVDLDGNFGFHPALAPLKEAWNAAHLSVVHACGAPDESRSHFLAMELMERGVEEERGPASGWIGRHLATLDTGNESPLRAIGLGSTVPRSIRGPVPAMALRSITDFHMKGDDRALRQMQASLAALYSEENPLAVGGQETLEMLDTLQSLDPLTYTPKGRAYPDSAFGLSMKQVAMLIKADVGLEAAAVDVGGWDTHFTQGGSEGLMAGLLKDLGEGLAAFHEDSTEYMNRVTVVTLSEFGRRLSENGSLGTDHGHGGLMMLMGGNIVGGKVHGNWPGLEPEQLMGPGDLAVTTDYRDILSELCTRRLNNPNVTEIFPAYTATTRGVFR